MVFDVIVFDDSVHFFVDCCVVLCAFFWVRVSCDPKLIVFSLWDGTLGSE